MYCSDACIAVMQLRGDCGFFQKEGFDFPDLHTFFRPGNY